MVCRVLMIINDDRPVPKKLDREIITRVSTATLESWRERIDWFGQDGDKIKIAQCALNGKGLLDKFLIPTKSFITIKEKISTLPLLPFLFPCQVHYFNVEEHYRRGLAWYRAQMPFTLPGQLTVEKTPGYFAAPQAPARVWDVNPAVRLLLIVRDPAERLVSDYTQVLHNRLARNKAYQSLDELLIHKGHIDPGYKALQRSLYHQHLARWLAVFPREQIHVVDGDALIRYPFPELRKTERFLDLPPRISPNNFYYNTTKGFYCLLSSGHDKCLDESKGRPHAPLSTQAFKKLCRYFRKPNKLFFEMVGRSFSWC